jgi:hypothetical protein
MLNLTPSASLYSQILTALHPPPIFRQEIELHTRRIFDHLSPDSHLLLLSHDTFQGAGGVDSIVSNIS